MPSYGGQFPVKIHYRATFYASVLGTNANPQDEVGEFLDCYK
jgi:hypothetical protein